MSENARMAATMIDMLPNDEQQFALEMVKRIVRAWDPDFTKLTSAEAEELREAEADPETFTLEEVLRECAEHDAGN